MHFSETSLQRSASSEPLPNECANEGCMVGRLVTSTRVRTRWRRGEFFVMQLSCRRNLHVTRPPSMYSSDSQAMGRIGESFTRLIQTAHRGARLEPVSRLIETAISAALRH
jgi:hypothetical protein